MLPSLSIGSNAPATRVPAAWSGLIPGLLLLASRNILTTFAPSLDSSEFSIASTYLSRRGASGGVPLGMPHTQILSADQTFRTFGPVLVTIGDHRALECHILCIWKYPEQRVPSTTLSSYNKGCPNPAISLLMVEASQPWSCISSAFEKEATVVIKRKPSLLGLETPWPWPLLYPTS